MIELSRPAWAEIDLDAIAHNVQLTRSLIGPRVKLFGCVKADAYGCGRVPVARAFAAAGVDALAVADPYDVPLLRQAGLELPILLFASTLPEQAAAVATLRNVIVSVHDFPSLAAFAALPRSVDVYLKIDCGAARYGFIESQWREAFAALRRASNLRVRGIYAHPIDPEDRDAARRQGRTMDRACVLAAESGLQGFDRLFASSRFILGYPDLHYTAVDPGRLLLGHLPGEWAGMAQTRPVVRAIKSRIAQIQEHPDGAALSGVQHGGAVRAAVMPVGFSDGFPAAKLHDVLVCGQRAPVINYPRGIESTVIDVTDVAEAEVGSEVVLLGRQGDQEITPAELASSFGCSLFELMHRITRNTHKRFLGGGG